MNAERKKVLGMLASGKITADEADKLLTAIEEKKRGLRRDAKIGKKDLPKFLFVKLDSCDGDKMNIRVPLKLVRAGIKIKSLLPKDAKIKINQHLGDKGLNLDDINPENLDEFMESLEELEVNLDDTDGDKVRIYCGND